MFGIGDQGRRENSVNPRRDFWFKTWVLWQPPPLWQVMIIHQDVECIVVIVERVRMMYVACCVVFTCRH